MVCLSDTICSQGRPFLCSFIGITSMLGLVGLDRSRRSRSPLRRPRRSTDEDQPNTRQPLPRLRSTTSTPPTNRPAFRFIYYDDVDTSPPAIRRRSPSPEAAIRRRSPSPEVSNPATIRRQSPSPLLRRIQDSTSQPSFSSDNSPYDPLNPLEPPITAFLQYTTVTGRPIPNDPTPPISLPWVNWESFMQITEILFLCLTPQSAG